MYGLLWLSAVNYSPRGYDHTCTKMAYTPYTHVAWLTVSSLPLVTLPLPCPGCHYGLLQTH